jgi:hypothetical protein
LVGQTLSLLLLLLLLPPAVLQFVKPAFKTGRHFYVNEEMQNIRDAYQEAQTKQALKGECATCRAGTAA